MSGNVFNFKRFAVWQDGCAMKIGTDGVLLGAWCRILPEDKSLLDIGTGTGVIALQLAQRTEVRKSAVDAVEIDKGSHACASENFARSEWTGRLRLYHASVQDFARNTPAFYDHIVSNPPYFAGSLTSPDAARTLARHTASLSYADLAGCCDRLLAPGGRISLILPVVEAQAMVQTAKADGFHVSRRTEVWSTPKSGVKRILFEFLREPTAPETLSLTIEGDTPGTFSEEYRALTRDFYLYL